MTSSNLAEILKQVDNFPSLPATVNKVMTVTGDPESSASDLMNAILPDQSMCTTILKIANSAFFGIPRKVATMEQAVVVLGFDEIRNVVLGKAVFNSFQNFNLNKEAIDLFWEHSFTCGLAAKIIGEHLLLSPSELFIAGLIHDIGKLAMLITFPDEYSLLYELSAAPNHFRDVLHEQDLYSTSHDEIGQKVLNKWLFPEQLVMAAGYHHHPELAPSHRKYPIIVQMADMLSLMHCSPDGFREDDVATIFNDFMPEKSYLWIDNNLPWDSTQLGTWYTQLQEARVKDQPILDIMMSS